MSFRTAYHALGRGRSGPLPLIRDGSSPSFGKAAKTESWTEYKERIDREERERTEYFKNVARLMREERERAEWLKKLSAAQRNGLDQIEYGTWEPDRNG